MPAPCVHAAVLLATLPSGVQSKFPACSARSVSLASQRLSQFLEPFLQLQWELLITLLTNRLHVKLNKFVPVQREQIVTISYEIQLLDLNPHWLSGFSPTSLILLLFFSYI